MELYDKFLERLKEIREFEWNQYDLKIHEEHENQKGVREKETVLEAIARHMLDAISEEENKKLDENIYEINKKLLKSTNKKEDKS
jgi:hypothetical protein